MPPKTYRGEFTKANDHEVADDPGPRTRVVVYGDVDKGWAWMILLGMFLWNMLLAGTLKSFGVIYLEFEELYKRGPAVTAWLGFSFSFLTSILAPVSGYIGDTTSLQTQRRLVLILSLLLSVAVALTGWVSDLEYAILTYGIAGFAAGLMDSPILSLIGKYFRRHRFLASSVVFAGSSFGTLVLPPLLTLLVEAYAIRGAMTIFAGIWLHALVVGTIIRPVRPSQSTNDVTTPPRDDVNRNQNDIITTGSNQDENETFTNKCPECAKRNCSYLNRSMDTLLKRRHLRCAAHSISTSVPSSPKIIRHHKSTAHSVDNLDIKMHSYDVEESPPEVQLCEETTLHSTDHIGKSSNVCGQFIKICKDYWDFLKTPGLPLLILCFIAASFAYFSQFFLFPVYAQELGMSKMEGALLVSISNITELVSRLIFGILIDRKYIQKPLLMIISFVMSTVIGIAVTFFRSRVVMFVYSVLFGLLGGVFVPLCIPLMVELVQENQISSAAAIFVLVASTGIAIGPPILSAIGEVSGSYAHAFQLCNATYILALLAYLGQRGFLNVCLRRNRHKHPVILEQDIP